ncbi:MAG TPA: histidine kinase [Chitinophagaceae bacterium]|nr:histidine kinase [Chitinophagaceae bacterium]
MAATGKLNSFLFTLLGFNKTKNKFHILLIVLIHAIGWFLLFLLPLLFYPVRINDDNFYQRELIDKSLLVGIFYLNYYVLIPRFFLKKRYGLYTLLVFTLFILCLVQNIAIRNYYLDRRRPAFQFILAPPGNDDAIANRFFKLRDSFIRRNNNESIGPRFPQPESRILGVPRAMVSISLNNAISSFALLLLMGGFIRLAFSFVRNQNERKALENANLNAEVNFLKSQINPHFLFNTLNSIYSQAHNKSKNTEYSILKLSELLRYVLYDSGDDKIELAKDIQYINNYIDLQKMRLSSKITINYAVKGRLEGYKIAPLLLIVFIENAFKHGISYAHASAINIGIHVFDETLTLLVSNPVLERNSFGPGGLGLKNVMRRLDLLYSGKYLLDIQRDDYLHIVNLKLNLKDD